MLLHHFILTSLLAPPFSVLGYKIDASCTRQGVEQDVRDGMTGAFAMLDSALGRLRQDPYNDETERLIRLLFLPKPEQSVRQRYLMDKVRDVYTNIDSNYRNEITGTADVPNTDVVIYCDDSRYKYIGKRDKKFRKLYRDETTNEIIVYYEQSCHEPGLEWVSLAVTYNAKWETVGTNPETGKPTRNFDNVPTQIQLCPWFIDWIKNKDFKTGNQVKRSNIGRAVIKVVEKTNWGLRQIDAFSLLDKVLLHEMTHGRKAWENSYVKDGLADVPVPKVFGLPIGPWPAYGWKWARQLAAHGTAIQAYGFSTFSPDHNADSVALFGSACLLLDDPTGPRRVANDGRIIPIGLPEEPSQGN